MTDPVYLDHNATTPLAPSVADAISVSLRRDWANPGSTHAPGARAKMAADDARRRLAKMLGASPSDIVFTSGGTEASNMVLLAVPDYQLGVAGGPGGDAAAPLPHVVTSNVEHDATILPLRRLRDQGRIELTEVAVNGRGVLLVDDVAAALRPATRMVTVMLANNETGVLMPIKAIASRLREINEQRRAARLGRILLHSDVAQAVGKMRVDVDELGVDYLSLTGHKFYGPRSGCVYARGLGEGRTPLLPLLFGGGQEGGLRPGTLNVPMAVGLGEAARLVAENLDEYVDKMATARDFLELCLQREFGDSVVFNCRHPDVPRLPNTSNVSLVSLVARGDSGENRGDLRGHMVLSRCPGVLASVGACCHEQDTASTVLIRSGVQPSVAANAIRLSVGRDTTNEQVALAAKRLKQAYDEIVQPS